jgi:hypothetical protein
MGSGGSKVLDIQIESMEEAFPSVVKGDYDIFDFTLLLA